MPTQDLPLCTCHGFGAVYPLLDGGCTQAVDVAREGPAEMNVVEALRLLGGSAASLRAVRSQAATPAREMESAADVLRRWVPLRARWSSVAPQFATGCVRTWGARLVVH
jgi:hypothetical protein